MATPAKSEHTTYESNPFKVTFGGIDKLFKLNQPWGIAIIVIGLLSGFGQFYNSPYSGSGALSSLALLGIVFGGLAFLIAAIVLSTLYRGAVAYVALKTMQGEHVGFKDAVMASADRFWTLLGIEAVVFLKVLGGLLLFIVPGVRAALRYNMVFLPVFDKNAKAMEAITDIKSLTKDHILEIFGMSTAAGIVPIVGPALGVGGQIVIYPQLRKLKASSASKPPVHWLNYLGFILMAAFVLFALFITSLVFFFIALSKVHGH